MADTAERTPPLFPVQQVWTLALNNQLTVPAAFDASRAYFAIDGDRLVAYDLVSGEQRWIAEAAPIVAPATGDGLVFVVDAELPDEEDKDGFEAYAS